MNKYEIMFIVRPDLEEAAVKDVVANMKNILVNNGAKVTEEQALGQKELAYEINKYKSGNYFLFNLESNDAEAINEFNRLALINEDVIRHLTVRL